MCCPLHVFSPNRPLICVCVCVFSPNRPLILHDQQLQHQGCANLKGHADKERCGVLLCGSNVQAPLSTFLYVHISEGCLHACAGLRHTASTAECAELGQCWTTVSV